MITQTASSGFFNCEKIMTQKKRHVKNPFPKENYHPVNCKRSINFIAPFTLKTHSGSKLLRNGLRTLLRNGYVTL